MYVLKDSIDVESECNHNGIVAGKVLFICEGEVGGGTGCCRWVAWRMATDRSLTTTMREADGDGEDDYVDWG